MSGNDCLGQPCVLDKDDKCWAQKRLKETVSIIDSLSSQGMLVNIMADSSRGAEILSFILTLPTAIGAWMVMALFGFDVYPSISILGGLRFLTMVFCVTAFVERTKMMISHISTVVFKLIVDKKLRDNNVDTAVYDELTSTVAVKCLIGNKHLKFKVALPQLKDVAAIIDENGEDVTEKMIQRMIETTVVDLSSCLLFDEEGNQTNQVAKEDECGSFDDEKKEE